MCLYIVTLKENDLQKEGGQTQGRCEDVQKETGVDLGGKEEAPRIAVVISELFVDSVSECLEGLGGPD